MNLDILIVDDSQIMRAMIAKALQMGGMPLGETHQAGNGAEGLDVMAKHSIDLVLVDINMPIMGGLEMIDVMHQDDRLGQIPAIVISTEASETRIAMLEGKGVRFIHKPFTPEMLRDVMQSLFPAYENTVENHE